jgi:hypothetical protein
MTALRQARLGFGLTASSATTNAAFLPFLPCAAVDADAAAATNARAFFAPFCGCAIVTIAAVTVDNVGFCLPLGPPFVVGAAVALSFGRPRGIEKSKLALSLCVTKNKKKRTMTIDSIVFFLVYIEIES